MVRLPKVGQINWSPPWLNLLPKLALLNVLDSAPGATTLSGGAVVYPPASDSEVDEYDLRVPVVDTVDTVLFSEFDAVLDSIPTLCVIRRGPDGVWGDVTGDPTYCKVKITIIDTDYELTKQT